MGMLDSSYFGLASRQEGGIFPPQLRNFRFFALLWLTFSSQ